MSGLSQGLASRISHDPVGAPRFQRPRRGSEIVALQRVRDRLDGAAGRVVVVSAPAGYGKTSQVASWAASGSRPIAWLDLDVSENHPGLLAASIVGMLRRVDHESLSEEDHGRLAAGQSPPLLATSVLDALDRVEQPFVIVLDDVHVIDDPVALDLLSLMAHSIPDGSTAVLVGRSEPGMSLARLRVDDRVDEITQSELSLTAAEGRMVFDLVGVDADEVDDAAVAQYVAETEGWPVGVRFAALAERDDGPVPPRSLARLRVLGEYVHEEWLRGLDDDDMDFLLHVGGLEWLSGQLCDAVLGRTDSGARLERLYRRRLVVIPLDRRGDAYRLHGLIREVLDADFERLDRAGRRAVDLAAAAWYESARDLERAMRHAFRADDLELVTRLIVQHAPRLHTRGRHAIVRGWLDRLPRDVVETNPSLCLIAALSAAGSGEDAVMLAWIQQGKVVSRASGETSVHLALVALASVFNVGPVEAALHEACQAYERLPPGIWHAGACLAVGAHSFALGGDDVAKAKLIEGAAEAKAFGITTVRVTCEAQLAVLLGESGDWAGATATARANREVMRRQGLDNMPTLIMATAISALVEAMAGDPVTARSELSLTRQNLPYVSGVGAWANVQARLSLAHASLLLGDRTAARVLLEEARAYLRAQPDATRPREQLRILNERLDTARGSLPVGPSALTTAELRVLHLLPTNLSIAEIAQRLYVSRNTAKSHAAAVYRKLGASSRSQAVDAARLGGLLAAAGVSTIPP